MNYYDTLLAKATGGGGGGGGSAEWFGVNPVVVDSWTLDEKLSDTDFPSWTPSTSSSSALVLHAAVAGTPILLGSASVGGLELNKQYVAVIRYLINYAYTEEVNPRYTKSGGVKVWYTSPNTTATNWVEGSDYSKIPVAVYQLPTYSEYALYYNGSGVATAITANSPQNGIYMPSSSNPPLKVSTSGGKAYLTLYRPQFKVLGNNTYISVAALEKINAANTTIKAEAKLYQIDAGLPISAYEECADILTNGL